MNRSLASILLLLLFAPAAQSKAQWDLEESHTTANLRGIANTGGGAVWASGTNGTVLRSEDGGYLWQTCAIPPGAEKLDFRGIQAFDENTAIVMSSGPGDQSRLYKTTDGCQTWRLLFTNPDKEGFWDAIRFASRDFGVLLGDPVDGKFIIMLTFDGGKKWEKQTQKSTADINGEGAFAASNSSLLLSSIDYRMFGTGGPGGSRIITVGSGPTDVYVGDVSKTKKLPWEAGQDAAQLPTHNRTASSGIFSIAEDPSRTGTMVAVGGDYLKPSERLDTAWYYDLAHYDQALRSFWQPAQTPPHGYRSSVAYDPQQKLWITVGPNGTDISTDDGKNWHALKPSPTDPADADKN
ncbi:MAG: hypothetical protein M3Y50_06415 [Acidobacteriota bacterium]|nr:hypothetical protein [Acidobacteriota bacterium]